MVVFQVLFVLLFQFVEPGGHLSIEEDNGFAGYFGEEGFFIRSNHPAGSQLSKSGQNVAGDIFAFGHTREPGPAAVHRLEFLQFPEGGVLFGGHPGGVEEEGQALFTFALAGGFPHPGTFLEQDRLKLFVLFELCTEGIGGKGLPGVEDLADGGVAAGHMTGQSIGIEAAEDLL